jgi:4'-phosphopantetheinyl transferase
MHWLLESVDDLKEFPEAFLSAGEMAKYTSFRFPKRRDEWLLGRWTAKRLLQAVLLQQTNEIIARSAVEILNDGDGVPYAKLHEEPLAIHFSLSHSTNHALCACYAPAKQDGTAGRIGADLEFIEPRDEYLVRDYFTAQEAEQVAAIAPALRDTLITAIWSAKEAVLKALHKGLSVDTRTVDITMAPFAQAPSQWAKFEIQLNLETQETLYGWWRVQEGFVLTLAGNAEDAPDATPLTPEVVLVTSGDSHEGHGVLHHRIAQATRHHSRHAERD